MNVMDRIQTAIETLPAHKITLILGDDNRRDPVLAVCLTCYLGIVETPGDRTLGEAIIDHCRARDRPMGSGNGAVDEADYLAARGELP